MDPQPLTNDPMKEEEPMKTHIHSWIGRYIDDRVAHKG